jgi:predicted amidophosphoribosyltransferase
LIKTKLTPPQSGIDDHDKRKNNVAGVFAVNDPGPIQKKNILLVDDIFTSGATMNECARVLKAAGAHNIYGIVVVR